MREPAARGDAALGLGPLAQQVVIHAVSRTTPPVRARAVRVWIDSVEFEQQRAPLRSSRTRLWTQKNDANRVPRVTGWTRCRLLDGYTIRSPAGSLTSCSP